MTTQNAKTLAWVVHVLERNARLLQSGIFDQGAATWRGAVIDSRGTCEHRLFFGLQGEHANGSRFAGAAAAAGAVAVVVDDESVVDELSSGRVPFLLVDDALRSLQALSVSYRLELDARVVAITGSAGKTTTKRYLRALLETGYRVHANPGNLNNHIGVPLTILETDPTCEFLVSEVGANHIGEIELLCAILQPHIAVITNIGDAHIGEFGSRDRIADAKSELLDSLPESGVSVLPLDDDYYVLLNDRARGQTVTFGVGDAASFRVSDVERRNGFFDFRVNGDPYTIASFGEYNVLNAAAAIATGSVCGVGPPEMRDGLRGVAPLRGRAVVHRLAGVVVIDDSYNANPTSMQQAVVELAGTRALRRIAVLGDMAELGQFSNDSHRRLGELLGRSAIDEVFWMGESGAHVGRGLTGSSLRDHFYEFDGLEPLAEAITRSLRAGDAVLFKGSRSCQLDRVVDVVLDHLKGNEV